MLMSMTGAFTKAPVSIATTPVAMEMKSQMDQQIASFEIHQLETQVAEP